MAYRPIEPPSPGIGVAMRAIIRDNESALPPRRINAKGFVPGGDAEALGLCARLLAERASEWGGRIMIPNVDLTHAFGSVCHDAQSTSLCASVGPVAAAGF